MRDPTGCLIKGNENTETATRGCQLGQNVKKIESLKKTPLTSLYSMFEIDWAIGIPYNSKKRTIYSQFVATWGPKLGLLGPNANRFWTLT